MMQRTTLRLIVLATGLVFSSAASAAQTITYTYDARGRLIKVVRDDATVPANDARVCYYYDKADNRTRVKVDTGSLPVCP